MGESRGDPRRPGYMPGCRPKGAWAGARFLVGETPRHEGVESVTVLLHYGGTKHRGGVEPTSSDRPRDHEFFGTGWPACRWAERAPSPGRVVVGEGPAEGPAGVFFAIWGWDLPSMSGRAGLRSRFLHCKPDCAGVILVLATGRRRSSLQLGERSDRAAEIPGPCCELIDRGGISTAGRCPRAPAVSRRVASRRRS